MTRDWPTANELKRLKATDRDAYRRVLDSIAERRGVAPDPRAVCTPAAKRGGVDQLVEHLRRAYSLTDGETSQLGLIRRGAICSCVTLRADMLSGVPVRPYRLGAEARGRRLDLADPLRRLGMPTTARGVRLAEVGTVTEVEGSDIARRLAHPNEDWTGRMLVRQTELGLGLAGQAHWQLHGRGPNADRPPSAQLPPRRQRAGRPRRAPTARRDSIPSRPQPQDAPRTSLVHLHGRNMLRLSPHPAETPYAGSHLCDHWILRDTDDHDGPLG